jgi:hypothetical protein
MLVLPHRNHACEEDRIYQRPAQEGGEREPHEQADARVDDREDDGRGPGLLELGE